MTKPGLTSRQQKALDLIVQFQARHGRTPSVRELAELRGGRSLSAAHRQIVELEARGYITRLPGKARSIAIIDNEGRGGVALPHALEAKLDAYCRIKGEKPADVIADAVTLFLDAEEGAEAA